MCPGSYSFTWLVPSLYCIEHEGFDGLEADQNGLLHGVIVNVPVSVMEKAGTYRFVLHFYDDYADSYKNHKVKAALEVNIQRRQPRGLVLLIDTAVPTGTSEDEISEADLQFDSASEFRPASKFWI